MVRGRDAAVSRRQGLFRLPALFLPVLACVVAPWAWALWRTGGREFLVTAFWANQFGRFLTFSDASLPPDPYFVHKEPIYFYLLHLPVRLLPWTLLAAAALARWFQRRSAFREPLTVFMRLALVAMLLVLHVSAAKAACYLMPTLPIIFLMTGCWLEHGTAHGLRRAERWLIKVSFGIVAFLALALPAGYAAAYLAHVRQVWAPAGCTATAALIFALLALGLGLRALVKFWPEFRAELNLPALNRALMVLVAVFILDAAAVLPALDYQRDYRPFAALVRQARAAGRRVAAAGLKEREAAAFAFYADTRLDVIELDGRVRTYLLAPDQPAAVVVQRKQLAAVSNLLEGVAFTCQESAHGGYKSRQFALIMPTGSNP